MTTTAETPADPGQKEFWDAAIERDYLNSEQVEKFGVKYVRLLEFRDYHHDEDGKKDGLVFNVEVLNGSLKGKQKEFTIWNNKAVKLRVEFGTSDFGRWVGSILSLSFEGSGKYKALVLHKYEKLDEAGAQAPAHDIAEAGI